MAHPLDLIIQAQKHGEPIGITSICSSLPQIAKEAFHTKTALLFESTCNQVNQQGGYTGMTPAKFASFIHHLAVESNFPTTRVILGGDHLGPSPWQSQPAEIAMNNAIKLVRACVEAGYTKIHLDASMKLGGDDPLRPLDFELVADRTLLLAKAAEDVAPQRSSLRYVIGTDVPVPGGVTTSEKSMTVTSPADTDQMIKVMQTRFRNAGLASAWDKVIAIVVQPGVEFGDGYILDYDHSAALQLVKYVETTPFVYEVHSTDYQLRENLRALVRDHFAILKVGPALTFAFREAIFSLEMIEKELFPQERCSNLSQTLDTAMMRIPTFWQNYYHGTSQGQAFSRKYSFSDRVRYYWPIPAVQNALQILLENLRTTPIPVSLLSQFLPDIYPSIRNSEIKSSPEKIIAQKIRIVLDNYAYACSSESNKIN
jgi:D-tagatose-1,6-bisphosphate aldolase subunit GatZ/KbaZ